MASFLVPPSFSFSTSNSLTNTHDSTCMKYLDSIHFSPPCNWSLSHHWLLWNFSSQLITDLLKLSWPPEPVWSYTCLGGLLFYWKPKVTLWHCQFPDATCPALLPVSSCSSVFEQHCSFAQNALPASPTAYCSSPGECVTIFDKSWLKVRLLRENFLNP